jgi:hypothetical protein
MDCGPHDLVLHFLRSPGPGTVERVALRGPRGLHVAAQDLDPASLVPRAMQALKRGLASDPTLSEALWDLLPKVIQEGISTYLRDRTHDDKRLLLCFDESSAARALPWEHLRFGAAEYPQHDGRLALARWIPGHAQQSWPWTLDEAPRVLLLLGYLRQDPGKPPAESTIAEALRVLEHELEQRAPGFTLEIAGPSAWLRGLDTPRRVRQIDDLEALMSLGGRERYAAIVYLGHSDGALAFDPLQGEEQAQIATGVSFFFPGRNTTEVLAVDSQDGKAPSLVRFLRTTGARAFVLGACLIHHQLAASLLGAVDHLIATTSEVHPRLAARFAAAFTCELFGHGTTPLPSRPREPGVSQAMQAARAALQEDEPELGVVAHWMRASNDAVERTPEMHALRRYLGAVSARHAILDGPLGQGLRDANQVLRELYIELSFASEKHHARQRGGALRTTPEEASALESLRSLVFERTQDPRTGDLVGRRLHDRPTLLRLLELGPEHGCTRRWVLLAGATDGKTTTLRSTARQLAESRALHFVPIYLSFHELLANGVHSIETLVATLPELAEHRGFCIGLARSGRLAVFVDALDEVPTAKRQAALELLGRLEADLAEKGASVLVIASRDYAYNSPPFFGLKEEHERRAFLPVTLLPLCDDQRDQLLHRWLAVLSRDDDAKRRYPGLVFEGEINLEQAQGDLAELLQKSLALRVAARNPFVAALLARRFARKVEEIPRSRRELYRGFLEDLLSWKNAPDAENAEPEDLQAWEAKLARLQAELRSIALGFARAQHAILPKRDCKLAKEPRELAERAGIFVPRYGDGYAFGSQILQDHFTAEAIAEEIANAPSVKAVAKLLEREAKSLQADLGEVLILLTEYLEPDQQSKWVEELFALDEHLGLRAAALAQKLDAKVLTKALGLSSYWETRDRLNVLAEEMGDEDSWLSLLVDALEKTTSNELRYTIDEHLCARPWRSDSLAKRARGALDQVLAQLDPPLPVENEFVEIPSPADLRKKLGRPFELQEGLAEDEFWMGSPEDEPDRRGNETRHPVRLSRAFELGRTPVTHAQYRCFSKQRKFQDYRGFVLGVSWFDAQLYLRYRQVKEGRAYRLATEAEMEWAMRGGTASAYWWGEDARTCDALRTRLIEQEGEAHPFGLVGFWGNGLLQWVEDGYGDYPERDLDGQVARGVADGVPRERVLRGGSWCDGTNSRSARRFLFNPLFPLRYVGFRLALSPPPEP